MTQPNPAALDFLATRRSHPPKLLRGPAPDRAEVTRLLTLAARAPDHGKLEPWRFIVLGRQTLDTLRPAVAEAGEWLAPGGALVLELGAGQGEAVGELAQRAGFVAVRVVADLAGLDRTLVAERP